VPSSLAIDSAWLSTWVQPQHLDADAVAAARAAFLTHPLRLGVLPSFLLPGRARQLSDFLLRQAVFRADHDRLYRMQILEGAAEEFRLGAGVVAHLRFMQAIEDRRFIALVEALTGLTLGAATTSVHAMTQGDYLLAHDDDLDGRRVAFVLFLTPDWPEDAGGVLRFSGRDAGVSSIRPEYNSLALFDVTAGTSHEVGVITPAAGDRARVTISGWFLAAPPRT